MAKDNLTAVLYGINDIRLVSFFAIVDYENQWITMLCMSSHETLESNAANNFALVTIKVDICYFVVDVYNMENWMVYLIYLYKKQFKKILEEIFI